MEEALQFGKLLKEAASSSREWFGTIPCLSKLFKNEFLALPLPRQVHLSLTDFTGPQDNVTVLICKHVPQSLNKDSYSCEEAETSTVESTDDSTNQLPQFPLESVRAVCVGYQSAPLNHSYLPSSHPLLTNQPTNQIHSFLQAHISDLTPLPLDNARYIASLYSLSTKKVDSLPNLWILCSSEKPRIASIGCSFANSTLYIHTVISGDTVKIQSSGKGKKASSGVAKQQTISPGSAFSRYIITGSARSDEEGAGCLTVEFSWSDAERPLCPPSESAAAVVKVTTTPGYIFSPVLSAYNELCTLLTFCKIHTGTSDWPSQETPCGPDSGENLSQKIENFLKEVASPLSQPLDTTVISPTADNSIYETRKDLDFCERLWVFAKDSSSLESLQQTFAAVFKALLTGKVQPFVHRTSSSSLAKLVRQLLRSSSTEERRALTPHFQSLLSPSRLVLSLVEIGLEKMRRDYRTFFVSSDISTSDQLDTFLAETMPTSTQKQCHTLCKLHCVLEIVASLQSFLNLPSATLSTLTKTALSVYKETTFSGFGPTPIFSLPILAYSSALKSLISLCTKMNPTLWAASPSKEKTMVMYRTEPVHGRSEDSDSYCVYYAKCDTSCM